MPPILIHSFPPSLPVNKSMTSAFHQSGLALRLFWLISRFHLLVQNWKLGRSRLYLEDLSRGKETSAAAFCMEETRKVEYASGIRGATLNSNLKCTSSRFAIDYQLKSPCHCRPKFFFSFTNSFIYPYISWAWPSQVEATKRPYHFKWLVNYCWEAFVCER